MDGGEYPTDPNYEGEEIYNNDGGGEMYNNDGGGEMKTVIPRPRSAYNIGIKRPGTSPSVPAPPGTHPAFERTSVRARRTKPEVKRSSTRQTGAHFLRGLVLQNGPNPWDL